MNHVFDLSIDEMKDLDFQCGCGSRHVLPVHKILMGKGVLSALTEITKPFSGGKLLLLSDQNTWAAAGEPVYDMLVKGGHQVKSFSFDTGDDMLIPNEEAVGRMFMEFEPDMNLVVVIGAGTLNDMSKYLSHRTRVPYIVVCSAPSMDGYLAIGAPLICNHFKTSYPAHLPYAVVADIDILKAAPTILIQAGFGDAIGKITALADWKLASVVNHEHHCSICETLIRRALEKVATHADGILRHDENAILYLIEALNLSGVAMGLFGNSRPAGGSEHLMSHYLEMNAIKNHLPMELHGIKVGIGTRVVAEIYSMVADELPVDVRGMVPPATEISELLKSVGMKLYPSEANISKELFRETIMRANTTKSDRYGILDWINQRGQLSEIADRLTEKFYG